MITRKWMILSLVIVGVLLTGISIKPVLAFTGSGISDQDPSGWLSKTRKPQPSATPKTQTPTPYVTKTSIFRTATSPQSTPENTLAQTPIPKSTLAATSADHDKQTASAAMTEEQWLLNQPPTRLGPGIYRDRNPCASFSFITIPIGLTLLLVGKSRNRHTEL